MGRTFRCDGCSLDFECPPTTYVDSNLPLVKQTRDRRCCPHSILLCDCCSALLQVFLQTTLGASLSLLGLHSTNEEIVS